MANTLLTVSQITNEALMVLENNLSFVKGINREYSDEFAKSGFKIGNTLNIRKPPRYIGRSGATMSIEDQTDTSVPLVINNQFGVDVQYGSSEMALSLDMFSDRFIKPAMATIANKIDRDCLSLYKKVPNAVGVPGSTASAFRTYLNAGVKLDNEACPMDGQRYLSVDPLTQAGAVDTLKGLFQSSTDIASQYRKGQIGTAAGFDWAMDQNVWTHVVGSAAANSITVNGASQTGSVLTVAGLVGTLNEGDIITLAGVDAVNPQSRQSTGQLRQFVVTATTTGGTTIPIYPAIIPTGQFQNVTASPANSAVVTVDGAAGAIVKECLAYHPDAFTLACVDLPMPGGQTIAKRVASKKVGLSLRLVQGFDITNDRFPARFDVLYGFAAIRPELACRVRSGATP